MERQRTEHDGCEWLQVKIAGVPDQAVPNVTLLCLSIVFLDNIPVCPIACAQTTIEEDWSRGFVPSATHIQVLHPTDAYLHEQALLRVHELRLRAGDAKCRGIETGSACHEAAEAHSAHRGAVAGGVQIPGRVRHGANFVCTALKGAGGIEGARGAAGCLHLSCWHIDGTSADVPSVSWIHCSADCKNAMLRGIEGSMHQTCG